VSEPGYICPSCREHVAFKRAPDKVGDWWVCSEMQCVVSAREIVEINPGTIAPQNFMDHAESQRPRTSDW
jgi:hypothetical protein